MLSVKQPLLVAALLLLGHPLGEQPLGFLGAVVTLPRDPSQERCQFFILANGSGAGEGLVGPLGKSAWYLWASSIRV